MAFPTVQGTPVNSTSTTLVSSHTLNLPTGITAGERLFIIVSVKGVTTMTVTGWTVTELISSANSELWMVHKEATGSEGASVGMTTDITSRMTGRAWRISGHDSAQAPTATALSNGTTANPNPPSHTPSWGALDTLWFAFAVNNNGTATVSVFPTNYTTTGTVTTANTGGMTMAYGQRNLNAASDDPSALTYSSSTPSVSATVAIKPAGAAAPTSFPPPTDTAYRILSRR